jgi:hypothetical protein
MMDGMLNKIKQKRDLDMQMLDEIEQEMERKAIAASMLDQG